jgi:hypothetical protein
MLSLDQHTGKSMSVRTPVILKVPLNVATAVLLASMSVLAAQAICMDVMDRI